MAEQITMKHLTGGQQLESEVEPEPMDKDELSNVLHEDVDAWLTEFGRGAGAHHPNSRGWLEEFELDTYLGFKYKLVHSEGGFEGGGEHAERVYEVLEDDVSTGVFFQLDGFYSSYNGTDWDDYVTRVKPVQVMVTQYHEVE